MAYTNIWDDTKPTGSEPANTIDDLMRSGKVDIEQRFNDMFAMPSFATDPLRLYGLKFTDAQDSVINLGDNGGTPRNLVVKNKAGSTTYSSFGTTSIFSSPVLINNASGTGLTITQDATGANLFLTLTNSEAVNGKSWKFQIIGGGVGQSLVLNTNNTIGNAITIAGNTGLVTFAGGLTLSSGKLVISGDLDLPGAGLGITNGTTRFLAVASGTNPALHFATTGGYTFDSNITVSAGGLTVSGGAIILNVSSPNIVLNDTSGTGTDVLTFQSNGVSKWFLGKGVADNTLNFQIYNVVTSAIGLAINSATNLVSITNGLTVAGGLTVSTGTSAFQALTCTTLGPTAQITSSMDGRLFLRSGASTGPQWFDVGNTTGHLILGVEVSSGASLLTGSTGYSTVLFTNSNTVMHLGTNSVIAITISTAQLVTIASGLVITTGGLTVSAGGITANILGVGHAPVATFTISAQGTTNDATTNVFQGINLAGTSTSAIGSDGSAFFSANVQCNNGLAINTGTVSVLSGFLFLNGATTAHSSLRIQTSGGAAPTSPTDGDMWYDGTNVKFRVGAVTKTFTLT